MNQILRLFIRDTFFQVIINREDQRLKLVLINGVALFFFIQLFSGMKNINKQKEGEKNRKKRPVSKTRQPAFLNCVSKSRLSVFDFPWVWVFPISLPCYWLVMAGLINREATYHRELKKYIGLCTRRWTIKPATNI